MIGDRSSICSGSRSEGVVRCCPPVVAVASAFEDDNLHAVCLSKLNELSFLRPSSVPPVYILFLLFYSLFLHNFIAERTRYMLRVEQLV